MGDVAGCQGVLQDMIAMGGSPSIAHVNVWMQALLGAGRYDEVLQAFEALTDTGMCVCSMWGVWAGLAGSALWPTQDCRGDRLAVAVENTAVP